MHHRANPGASTQIFLTVILSQRSPLDKLSVIMAVLVFMPFSQQPSHFQVQHFTFFCLGQAQSRPRWDAVT